MADKKLTLVQHLEELRTRLLKSIIFIIACSVFTYTYINEILLFLSKPIGKLIFIAPQEAFVANLQIAFFGGLFFASPFVLCQVWQFVSAGLRQEERKYALIFGLFSFILFIAGCLFGFFVIVPIGIKFLMGYTPDFITPMITLSNYISFLGVLSIVFGLAFQLPLILAFLAKIGLVNPDFLSRKRREAIVVIFIVAAILTPPDVFTQIMMAVPLVILYESGIILSRLIKPKKRIGLLS
ncbi:MAG: twin-arginine translocase subunit TatC [Candidatus Omnitrophica bacterium]|nr:twin-arginine translocase subunit TatC [Candidatus Omnitrophota bacterium]